MYQLTTEITLILISSLISIYILFDFFNKVFTPVYSSKKFPLICFISTWLIFTFLNFYSVGIINFAFSLIVPFLIGKYLFGINSKKDYGIIMLFILLLHILEVVGQVIISIIFSEAFDILPGNILEDLIIFCFYQFVMYIYYKNKEINNIYASVSSIALILVPIASFIIILTISFTMSYINNSKLLFSLSWVCIAIFIADIYIFFLFNKLGTLYIEKSETLILQQEKELQSKYYKKLEVKYNQYRQLAHDVKRHIGMLNSLYNQGHLIEANTYYEQLKGLLDSSKVEIYTNNRVINILINDKIDVSKKYGIKFKYSCEDTEFSSIEDIDLTIILSNLLDNAFEECLRTPDKANEIVLCICKINNFNIINITNTCYNTILKNNDKFLTTKKGHSGLGMINVTNTCKKYNGSILTKLENNIFTTQITFPKF